MAANGGSAMTMNRPTIDAACPAAGSNRLAGALRAARPGLRASGLPQPAPALRYRLRPRRCRRYHLAAGRREARRKARAARRRREQPGRRRHRRGARGAFGSRRRPHAGAAHQRHLDQRRPVQEPDVQPAHRLRAGDEDRHLRVLLCRQCRLALSLAGRHDQGGARQPRASSMSARSIRAAPSTSRRCF